jgi:hypothetical protein
MLRYLLLANASPSAEDFSCQSQSILYIVTRPFSSYVVVRFVTVFLQLGEFTDDLLKLGLGRHGILLIAEVEYRSAHSAMLKHPTEPSPLIRLPPIRHEIRYQQVEHCIVRS